MKWYVLQAYSGYENKVKQTLEDMIKREGLEDSFGEILVPTEEVLEIKEGQKKRSERKYFPGYVMIKMDLNDNTWHKVKNSPKVLGFVGGTSDKPVPLENSEAENSKTENSKAENSEAENSEAENSELDSDDNSVLYSKEKWQKTITKPMPL